MVTHSTPFANGIFFYINIIKKNIWVWSQDIWRKKSNLTDGLIFLKISDKVSFYISNTWPCIVFPLLVPLWAVNQDKYQHVTPLSTRAGVSNFCRGTERNLSFYTSMQMIDEEDFLSLSLNFMFLNIEDLHVLKLISSSIYTLFRKQQSSLPWTIKNTIVLVYCRWIFFFFPFIYF